MTTTKKNSNSNKPKRATTVSELLHHWANSVRDRQKLGNYEYIGTELFVYGAKQAVVNHKKKYAIISDFNTIGGWGNGITSFQLDRMINSNYVVYNVPAGTLNKYKFSSNIPTIEDPDIRKGIIEYEVRKEMSSIITTIANCKQLLNTNAYSLSSKYFIEEDGVDNHSYENNVQSYLTDITTDSYKIRIVETDFEKHFKYKIDTNVQLLKIKAKSKEIYSTMIKERIYYYESGWSSVTKDYEDVKGTVKDLLKTKFTKEEENTLKFKSFKRFATNINNSIRSSKSNSLTYEQIWNNPDALKDFMIGLDYAKKNYKHNQEIAKAKKLAKDAERLAESIENFYAGRSNYYAISSSMITLARVENTEPKQIRTSRGAIVPFDEGIKVLRLFYKVVASNENNKDKFLVGHYKYDNISFNEYINTWTCTIGCHTFTKDRIDEFVEKFNLQEYL